MRLRSKRWQRGQDRDRHLADFGGGEDEKRARRRLFEGLQEAVERFFRQHVDFVDDVDLVACRGRCVAHAVHQLADVVDAGVGRGVHLQDVDMAAVCDRDAMLANAAGLRRRLALAILPDAVERARNDPGRRRLADAANAGEQIGMRDTAGAHGVGKGAYQGVLADQLGEFLRPIGPRQHPVRGASGTCLTQSPFFGRRFDVGYQAWLRVRQ